MPPAVAIAGIGAAASIGGAVLGSRAQSSAARSAANSAAENSAANNALTREIYGQNASRLDPYSQGGLRAGNALQGLLGIGGTAPSGTVTTGALGPNSFTPEQQWAQGAINAMLPNVTRSSVRNTVAQLSSSNPVAALDYLMQLSPPSSDQYPLYQQYASSNPRPAPGAAPAPAPASPPATGTPATGTGTGTTPTNPALSAWDTFRNSTNYQWRFGEGQKALEMSGLPGGGYDSGQTRKAIVQYGQNFAANELSSYMDRLAQQQSFGVGAASALAGVSQNMVGNVTANNNAAAGAAANAALVNGTAQANMYSGIANGIGTAVGALGRGGSLFGGGGNYSNYDLGNGYNAGW